MYNLTLDHVMLSVGLSGDYVEFSDVLSINYVWVYLLSL